MRLAHPRRYANLRKIEQLDPAVDFDEIIGLVAYHEFPWEYVQGTSIAFMRDYGVPSISDLLDRTGRFEHDGQKRHDDTVLIGEEAVAHGIDSERAHATIRRLNGIHGHDGIPNHEFRSRSVASLPRGCAYVLATTLVGPKRFIDRYGYRPLHAHEVEAMARVTTRLGELMGIKELPSTYADYERLLDAYEAERVALGLPRQPDWLVRTLDLALRTQARLLRLLPPRRPDKPYRHDASRTYPLGYSLADLGPRDHSDERHRDAPERSHGRAPKGAA